MKLTKNQKKINRLQNTIEKSISKLTKMYNKLTNDLKKIETKNKITREERESIDNLLTNYDN